MAGGTADRSAEIPTPTKESMMKHKIDARTQQQAQHTAVISLTVRNTNKILKEIGFRRARLRNVYKKCTNAVQVLNEFKDSPWPHQVDLTAEEEASGENGERLDVLANTETECETVATDDASEVVVEHPSNDCNVGDEEVNEGAQDENLDGSAGDGSNAMSFDSIEMAEDNKNYEEAVENDAEFGEENGQNDGEDGDTNNFNSIEPLKVGISNAPSEDDMVREEAKQVLKDSLETSTVRDDPVVDGFDNEQMHPAIKTALSCYCSVINNENSTAKMVEISLECIGLLISNRYVVGSTIFKRPKSEDDDDSVDEKKVPEVLYLINCICERADHISDTVQAAISKALLALMTSPVCGVYEAGMLKAVRTVFHIYLVTKHENVKQVTRAVLLDMLRSVFSRMEAYDAMSLDNGEVDEIPYLQAHPSAEEQQNTIFASRFHTDSYLLFRALCKLSAKLLPEDMNDASSVGSNRKNIFTSNAQPTDPMATKTKILSLRLILSVFENCGPAFRNGEKFIYAVQNFLCVSLVKNSMSNNPNVAHLSLKVFLLLVYKFKQHLKAEIEVFVAKVFLPTLQSPNTPAERKSLVLEALRALCADPVILTQIFLNYDCDFEAVDLYKTIVSHLTSLSVKDYHTPSTTTAGTEKFSVNLAALEVLVVTLQAFLKALKLPGGDDIFDEETSKVRGSLQLDVGLAVKNESEHFTNLESTKEEMVVSSKDIENIENTMLNGDVAPTEDVAGKIVDAFDKKRMAQRNFETGSIKFRLSAKQGILFFVQHGIIHLDAKEIALFFLENKEKLDKTQMGEIFGREPDASFVKEKGVHPEKGGVGFYIRVLHHYVDALDFSGLKFDDAIRLFLSGFRLPGESQKVDRIMEKFAERYTLQNEDIFPSADTAFILSFAVIMLQTDLHNPNIKPEKKMTAESFINMNKGISVDGADLDPKFLTDIFYSIKARPFTLKEDDDARESQKKSKEKMDIDAFFGGTTAKEKKRERFNQERAQLVEASEHLFKKQKSSSSTVPKHLTESVCPADVVKPMFDITWGPLIGTLSQILEKANDDSSIKLCLNGFVYAVRIAAYSDMDLAKNTFVTSLAKFTALGSGDEMKLSNIESIRTLLSISIMDGEKLGDTWRPILHCISQVGRLQFFASGVDSDDSFLTLNETKSERAPSANRPNTPKRGDAVQRKDLNSKAAVARETEEFNSRAVLEAINEILIEKVFTSTTKLSDGAILDFVDSLVLVSESEIGGDSKKDISGVGRSTSGSRIYSLQKLVEVADYNMSIRSRRSWAKIWDSMADHLVTIGCHKNAMVSMFAIDALRQLSFKFLEKPELADFNFQRLFLRPFLSIMENTGTREDTRELILQCVDNSIRSMYYNIRSGWKIFFTILALTADDSSERISSMGLTILQYLVDNHFDQLCKMDQPSSNGMGEEEGDREMSAAEAKERNTHAEDFTGLCRASLSFVESKKGHDSSISMRTLCHAAVYADHIVGGKVLPPVSGVQSNDKSAFGFTYEGLSDEDAKEMVLWRPILDGLAHGMCSSITSGNAGGVGCIVQRGSVITLRAILLRHGHIFSVSQWNVIMNQVILPAMQVAIQTDKTSVTNIISESPLVSNLDFFSEPLALPPPVGNEGLRKFAAAAQRVSSGPTRPYGDSELLVEASFADLRHGGDGDLTKAYKLVEKVVSGQTGNHEEPFPDSWVATTGPIALGMLTDFFCMIVMRYKVDDARKMWPIVMGQMQRWAVGSPLIVKNTGVPLSPCEALVRIGCKEISRLSETLITLLPRMNDSDVKIWLDVLCKNLADTLSYSIGLEGEVHDKFTQVFGTKNVESNIEKDENKEDKVEEEIPGDEQVPPSLVEEGKTMVSTAYGNGELITQRVDKYLSLSIDIDVVRLDSGATLYGPKVVDGKQKTSDGDEDSPAETTSMENVLAQSVTEVEIDYAEARTTFSGKDKEQFISPLRLRCTASYCLQKCFSDFLDLFSTNCGKGEISALLQALEKSRVIASKASVDKDLSTAFEDAILMEWGDKVEDTKKAFSSDGGVGHLRRSEMFFLTQEASANNILIHFLALLYCPREDELANQWDTVLFSEPLLMERITDVLQKFIISEREDGHRIDPNVW
eukprot:CAMPEP_0203668256 /NCGR_PEP_ID=MMETSP0090-20130426/4937_1 /ASSEMBLY_ACC=CAM_ASM_001088 /TAXON_ID=426623 /ORGANISM="Chaetoceros affinis, Strain CCMP159" /LENGTH=2105 /DNA_ID=CAMNT_0050532651 /DNA_START=189 /DNA_END=6503 /DNA_ORIENTATION=+